MNGATSSGFESAFVDFEGDLPETVDRGAVRRMAAVARVLDDGMRVPGTRFRFGLDPILGVVPGGGDAVGAAFSLYIVLESARLGVSFGTIVRMLANVAVDTLGGSVPILGTIFDAVWKANRRNVEMALGDLARGGPGTETDATTVPIE